MLRLKRRYAIFPMLALFLASSFTFLFPNGHIQTDVHQVQNSNESATWSELSRLQTQINGNTLQQSNSFETSIQDSGSMDSMAEADLADRGTKSQSSANYTHKIKAADVNLRESPNTTSKVVTRLGVDDKVSILSRSGEWVKVKTTSGTTGWVKNEFVVSKDTVTTKKAPKPVPVGQQAVGTAKKYLGVKYVWGGTSPKGFDCSGLTKYVYSKYGIRLNRVAADQAKQGTKVTRDKLKAGDLVFFDTDGGRNYINHVGMYIGNGQFIHASSGRRTHRVTVSSLSDSFYSKAFITARRIVN
ncbi:MAG: C40 family peptidase [Clostridia bacterium]|nr:C40 family peptidase [Clostridia bacterium]